MLETKLPCPSCRESGNDTKGDNLRVMPEGHGYCFACNTRHELEGTIKREGTSKMKVFPTLVYQAGNKESLKRQLSLEVCSNLRILSGTFCDKEVTIYEYDKGVKVRIIDSKEFFWHSGKESECQMLGLDKAIDYNKPIIITEGEEDAASCWEVGYQACSLKSGAGSVEKSIKHDIETLSKYKQVWLCLDNDTPGIEATKKALELLPNAKVINLNYFKDANEALMTKELNTLLDTQINDYVPEGLITFDQVDLDDLQNEQIEYLPITWLPKTNQYLQGGLEYGTLNLLFAGVGSGKTTLMAWLGYHLYMTHPNIKIANLLYEENEKTAPLRYIAMHYKLPVGKLRKDKTLLSTAEWKDAKRLFQQNDRLLFLGKECKRTSQGLFEYLDYIVNVKGCRIILLDHISYLIGRSGVSKHGERRDIDELLYKLQDFTITNHCIIIAVSHVTAKKEGKNFDEGEIPSVYSGRGSGALAQIPDVVIALARNSRDKYNSSYLKMFLVKNRWGGTVGETDTLIYNDDTGEFIVNE